MQRYYKLRFSRILALLIVTLCLAALVVLWMLPLPIWLLLTLSVVVLLRAGHCILFDARLHMQTSCVAFRLEAGEAIMLVLRCGSHMPAKLLASSVITPYLVIINVMFDDQKGRRSILIMPDAMSADSFRNLRTALRWGSRTDKPASA